MVSGRLVVVSGPSGVGKGTVVAALRRRRPAVELSVSATTRARRTGEREGVDYYFLDDATFDRLVGEGAFLEHATYAGRRYGTPARPVRERLQAGATVVLEIEVEGARQVRRACDTAVLVLLVPPSEEALRARLEARGTEDPQALAARLAAARAELEARGEFDHVVVNDDVDRAADALARIVDDPGAPAAKA